MPNPRSITNPARRFPTTRWTVVRQAGNDNGEEARAALESLCRDYRKPLHAFAQAAGQTQSDADDTVQEFLVYFLANGGFSRAERPKGLLRSYLLQSMRHFMIDQWRKEQTEKRGGKTATVPFDEFAETIAGDATNPLARPESNSLIAAYDREWARTTMDMTLAKLKESYEARGKGDLFAELNRLIDQETLSGRIRSETAARLGIATNALSVERNRFQQRLRKTLREIISRTVASKEDIDAEVRHLAAALAFEEPEQEDRGKDQSAA